MRGIELRIDLLPFHPRKRNGNSILNLFDTEFKCSGLLKLMSIIMPGMFRKSSLKEMESFKRFAEHTEHSA